MQVLSKGNDEFGHIIKEVLAYGKVDSTTIAPIKINSDGTPASDSGAAARQVIVSETITGNAAYSQYDVMGDGASIPFASVVPAAGGGGVITEAVLELEASVVPAGLAVLRLHLFNVTGPTIADNAAMALAAGSAKAAVGYQGYLEFPTPEDYGSTLVSQASSSSTTFVSTVPKPFKCAAAGTGLWGILETRAAISGTVPASLAFTIVLTIQPSS